MKSLPLPLRVAAGLAVTAVEHARDLPAKLAGLPVTVASQALQMSMRVQQQVTELAIRGDEVLAGLRPVEETPAWATFDEDVDESRYDVSRPAPFDRVVADGQWSEVSRNGHEVDLDDETDPWTLEQRALAEEAASEPDEPDVAVATAPEPAGVNGYDELSLPQLRARLRRFTVDELTELLDYERGHANRPAFVGMLSRRIATVRDHR
jgi:hypothetical protein